MNPTQVELTGTLQSDGTLTLDGKPALPPGRVTVVLRQDSPPAPLNEDWWQHLQRLRAEREAASYPFMNEKEVTAHIEWLREGDRIDDMLRELDEQRPTLEQS